MRYSLGSKYRADSGIEFIMKFIKEHIIIAITEVP